MTTQEDPDAISSHPPNPSNGKTRLKALFDAAMTYVIVPCFIVCLLVAYPSFLRSREIWRKNRCQEAQLKIEEAKERWAVDKYTAPYDKTYAEPTWDDLIGGGYLKKSPACAAGGTYGINSMDGDPYCSLSNRPAFAHPYRQRKPDQ